MSQADNSTTISSDDAFPKVLGKDHCGRVRCLGLGGLYSIAFKFNTKFSGVGCSSSSFESSESSQLKEEVVSLKAKLAASEENVKTLQNVMVAYIHIKEGRIPPELGAMFGNTTNPRDEESGQDVPTTTWRIFTS
ncbi:hypothetical protein JHK82_022961 [Glycine max]|nr:hypothetical protein JHK85_023472 [Glycine max]KAG5027090.1 hypothetical protein JHK86_023004 [Glycine max]KAG5138230.1 hypothetical protein JHK82_022961 [Glycine max]KAH1053780.1 hypothetical protein GYH30_022836 [Glycine max]